MIDYSLRWRIEPPLASVLLFERTINNKQYRYVALRTERHWYITGVVTPPVMRWKRLINFITDNPCWIISACAEVPQLVPVEAIDPQLILMGRK